MTLIEIITISAILLSPFLAVQATVWLNKKTEEKNRKMGIFRDLMATRATALSPKHVEALNRIEIEFYEIVVKSSFDLSKPDSILHSISF